MKTYAESIDGTSRTRQSIPYIDYEKMGNQNRSRDPLEQTSILSVKIVREIKGTLTVRPVLLYAMFQHHVEAFIRKLARPHHQDYVFTRLYSQRRIRGLHIQKKKEEKNVRALHTPQSKGLTLP
jgi:hypothetical protein